MNESESKPVLFHNTVHEPSSKNPTDRNVLISILKTEYEFCQNIEDCHVFLNFFQPGSWQAVDDLYKAWELKVPRVITINSIVGDWIYSPSHPARIDSIQSKAISLANSQLYWDGLNCTNLVLGDYEDGLHYGDSILHITDVINTLKYLIHQHIWIKEMTLMVGKNRREPKSQG